MMQFLFGIYLKTIVFCFLLGNKKQCQQNFLQIKPTKKAY